MSFPNCFIDSFQHYGTQDFLGNGFGQKWTGFGANGATSMVISGGTGRFSNSLRLTLANSGVYQNAYVFKTLASLSSWYFGFAFRATGFSTGYVIAALFDSGTTQVELRVNSSGNLFVTRNGTALTGGQSSSALTINTWYYIEWNCTISSSISSGQCNVNVNSSNTGWIATTAGQSTKNTGNATANQVALGNAAASFPSPSVPLLIDYCDLYIDGGGSVNSNTLWGDTKIECHWPVATGTYTAWTPNGALAVGSVNDETPNGDTNFISDNTTNDRSTYTFQPLASTPSAILCTQTTHASRKSDAGARSIADYCVSNGTTAAGTTVSLGNSYQFWTNVLSVDPHTSVAWTATGLNSAEFGVQEIS